MSAVTLFMVRATALLALALLYDRTLQRAPALHRHRLWTFTFVAILALPLLSALLPALPLDLPAGLISPSDTVATEPGRQPAYRPEHEPQRADNGDRAVVAPPAGWSESPAGERHSAGGSPSSMAHEPRSATAAPLGMSLAGLLLSVWGAGVAVAAAGLLRAQVRAGSTAREARPLVSPDWKRTLASLHGHLRLRREVALRTAPTVRMPMAGGVRRPLVLLPPEAEAWDAERRSIVLAHELAHHAHHDPLRHLIARSVLALLWFHPLAWLAARRSVLAREQACDERVVALGTRPSAYARHLLELAEALTLPTAIPSLTLPMIQRSLLETRLMSILTRAPRRLALRVVLVGTGALTLATLSVAAATPVPPTPPPAAAPVVAGIAPPTFPAPTLPAPIVFAVPVPTSPLQGGACEGLGATSTFSGTTTIRTSESGDERHERSGWSDGWRILQRNLENMRLCAKLAPPNGDWRDERSWTEVVAQGERVLLEVRREGSRQSMEIEGGTIRSWSVDGQERPDDDDAAAFRQATMQLVDQLWEATRLRGEVSSLRGQISSIRGQRSSLRGQISSARGQVSSMRGQISSARGQVSSLRGQISSLRGHVSSLDGAISSERGAISSLRSQLRWADADERARIDERIERHEARIRELHQEIEEFEIEERVREVEARIEALDTEGEVARIERQIEELDVEGRVEEIERRIEALDADRRLEAMWERIEDDERALERVVSAIR